MVVHDSDLEIRKSAHTAGGIGSLGGAMTSTVVTEATHSLWDEVKPTELSSSVVGEYEVRCIYICNNSPNNEKLEDVQVYVSQNTVSPYTDIDIATGTSDVGDDEQTVPSENTLPLHVFFTFARGEENAIYIGTLEKGQGKSLWIRRHAGPASAGSSTPNDNYFLGFKVRGTAGSPSPPPPPPPPGTPPPPPGGGGSANDKFGIRMIYATKPAGTSASGPWFMDMSGSSPHNSSDCRFSSSITIIKNADGSFRSTSTEELRLHTYISGIGGCNRDVIEQDVRNLDTYDHSEWASRGYIYRPHDWKNIEITGYYKIVRLNSGVSSGNVDFWIYTRGVVHSSAVAEGCGGCSYRFTWSDKGDDIGYQKEMYHNAGISNNCGDRLNVGTRVDSGSGNLIAKWFGIKCIIYNVNNGTDVHLETWMDKDNNNTWVKVKEETDSGGFYPGAPSSSCPGGESCGGTRDERFTWGSPLIRFNWRDVSEMHFRNFSVREIIPP